jgi:uncharacterized membrane protein/predicted DsbA family dithiol-disulfide isomerase
MSRALLNKITLCLAVLGCIIALVLTYEHFFPGADIGCGALGGNCHSTIESKYGKLGPIPTSILGLGMYLTLAGICVLRARSLAGRNAPGPDEKQLGIALFGISVLAFCISWWLQYASFFLIFSFCPWCFASALTVTAIFLVNAYDYLILGRALTGEQKMLSGVLVFIGAMLSFMYAPQIIGQVLFVLRPKVAQIAPPKHGPNDVGNHPREEILREGLVFKGKPTAQYTIVEFADYGCGHCKEASENMERLVKQYPDRYRLAFRNFPLGRWPWSRPEAEAAEAAAKQGKFWEMHDIMFAHQEEVDSVAFSQNSILDWAKSIGLDVDKLKRDMSTSEIRDRVVKDHDDGLINNVTLTPSFFVVPSDPNAKVMMIVGGADAKTVLSDPKNPFWRGDMSGLKDPETAAPMPPPDR